MQIISREDREKLNASEKSKLFFNFLKGIPIKFKGINTIVGLDNVSTIENISSFAEMRMELQRHITAIAAHPVFLVLKFDLSGNLINPDMPNGTLINILSSVKLPSLDEVEESIFYHFKRGTKHNRENLPGPMKRYATLVTRTSRQFLTRRCSSMTPFSFSVLYTITSWHIT